MTNKEKEALVKAAFPGIEGMDLQVAIGFVENNDTVATYKNRVKQPPKVMMGTVLTPKDALKAGKAGVELVKSVFTKKTAAKAAEEAAKNKAKMSLKKKAAIGAGVLVTGQAASSLMGKQGTEIDVNASAAELQAKDSFAQAIANADASGVDVTQFLQGNTAQQLGIGANNISDFMAARGYVNPLTGLNGIGIFTGKVTEGTKLGPKGRSYPTTKSEIVSLSDWNKSFPVDLPGVAAAKQKFVDAGVLSPTADLTQVKTAWNQYGQLSLDYSRAGNKVSPWQLLDIQKGLTGSGSQTTTTIDDSPMAKGDITTILKRQLGASLGLANIDDAVINKFIADVRKKEAKNPTKSVRTTTGNTTRVKTTPGYGQSDVLADAEAYAKQDPRYAEFQTADVFGNALVKALGLKS